MVGELDEDAIAPEEPGESVDFVSGIAFGVSPVRRARERLPHGALAAAGEHDPFVVRSRCERVEVVERPPLLHARELRFGDCR